MDKQTLKVKIKTQAENLALRAITTVILTLTAVVTVWVYAAFVEPAVGPNSSDQDFAQNILGNNDANNDFSSSSVVANADGSLIERDEYTQTKIGSSSDATTTPATANSVFAGVKYLNDAIGNKTDSEQTNVTTSDSSTSYLKGIIQELDQRKVPHMVKAQASSVNYADVVNITDKGVLNGISQNIRYNTTSNWLGSLKIIIDGTTVYDDYFVYVYNESLVGQLYSSNSLAFNFRFNTSLRIQHKVSSDIGFAYLNTFVSYTTDD